MGLDLPANLGPEISADFSIYCVDSAANRSDTGFTSDVESLRNTKGTTNDYQSKHSPKSLRRNDPDASRRQMRCYRPVRAYRHSRLDRHRRPRGGHRRALASSRRSPSKPASSRIRQLPEVLQGLNSPPARRGLHRSGGISTSRVERQKGFDMSATISPRTARVLISRGFVPHLLDDGHDINAVGIPIRCSDGSTIMLAVDIDCQDAVDLSNQVACGDF